MSNIYAKIISRFHKRIAGTAEVDDELQQQESENGEFGSDILVEEAGTVLVEEYEKERVGPERPW